MRNRQSLMGTHLPDEAEPAENQVPDASDAGKSGCAAGLPLSHAGHASSNGQNESEGGGKCRGSGVSGGGQVGCERDRPGKGAGGRAERQHPALSCAEEGCGMSVRADSAAGGGRLSAGHGVGTAGTAGNCMQRGKVRLSPPRYGGKYPPRCCSPELTTLPHSGIMKDGKRTFCCGKIKHEEE